MAFEFSIASSIALLDTPFISTSVGFPPKIEPVLPERVEIALSDVPKFAGWESRILRWEWMTEEGWTILKTVSGGANMAASAYIRCHMLDPLTLETTKQWADYSCIAVTPTCTGGGGETLRYGVQMEIRRMEYEQDSALTP